MGQEFPHLPLSLPAQRATRIKRLNIRQWNWESIGWRMRTDDDSQRSKCNSKRKTLPNGTSKEISLAWKLLNQERLMAASYATGMSSVLRRSEKFCSSNLSEQWIVMVQKNEHLQLINWFSSAIQAPQ